MSQDQPERKFKPKNWRRINGSCKLEPPTDEGVKKHWQCPECGQWSKKAKCPACQAERPKKQPARAGKDV